MAVSSLKNWLKILINEEINKEQLASTVKALGLPEGKEGMLEVWVQATDPTPNKSFAMWILRGLKKRQIQLEDQNRITAALVRFIQLRNAHQIEDIMQFPSLDALETRLQDLTGVGSRRQGFAGINPTTLPGVQLIQSRPQEDIVFYRVTNPDSLSKMGEGTKWCTRLSYNGNTDIAKRYIQQKGSIIVGYKGGKPFVQYNPDFSQVMDVNDVNMHGMEAKNLNLPKPTIELEPVQKWSMKYDPSSPEQVLKKWSDYTTQPVDLAKDLPKGALPQRDTAFEKKIAGAISKSNDFIYQLQINMVLSRYSSILNGQRSPEIENAILNKDWTEAWKFRSRHHGQHSRIPIMEGIVSYVKNAIKGNWPEFEKKYLSNDPYNATLYFNQTGLKPDFLDNTITKDIVIMAKYLEEEDPSVGSPQFEASLKDYYLRARETFKHSKFTAILYNVLIPYIKQSNKSVTELLGPEASRVIFKNTSILAQLVKIEQNRDPVLEKLLLTKINNVFKTGKAWQYRENFLYIFDYCKNVLKGPWSEYEKLIVHYIKTYSKMAGTDNTLLRYFAEYAVNIRKDNWEELRYVLSDADRVLFDKFTSIEQHG